MSAPIRFGVTHITGMTPGPCYVVVSYADGKCLPGGQFFYTHGNEADRLQAQLMAGAYAIGFKDGGTLTDQAANIAAVWEVLQMAREDCIGEGDPDNDAAWDAVCTAMAQLTEALGLPTGADVVGGAA